MLQVRVLLGAPGGKTTFEIGDQIVRIFKAEQARGRCGCRRRSGVRSVRTVMRAGVEGCGSACKGL